MQFKNEEFKKMKWNIHEVSDVFAHFPEYNDIFHFFKGGHEYVTQNQIAKYISYLYDKNSPLRTRINDLIERKRVALELTGVIVDKDPEKVPDELKRIVLGLDEDITDVIFMYLHYCRDRNWASLVIKTEAYEKTTKLLLNSKKIASADMMKQMNQLETQIDELTELLFGNDSEIPNSISINIANRRRWVTAEEFTTNWEDL